jgi:hypothetical protein
MVIFRLFVLDWALFWHLHEACLDFFCLAGMACHDDGRTKGLKALSL